ncbi:MAG: c-type cytochrome domain-containing protein [Pirellulaceae bacterium]|nr:c-type cytochrome domain-containing protein [Pirellulaceae bacterium]
MKRFEPFFLMVVGLGFVASIMLTLAATARGDEAADLFEKKVRPLLARKCFDCHSAKAHELKGNLKLDTLDDILKGGATGPAILPGDVENSFLLRAIRYQEDDYQMPPSGRMPDEDIALVEKWVRALQSE